METVSENFLAFAVKRMRLTQTEIARCVEQLSEEQMLHRAGPYENSITNLLLHLSGNLQQWILSGVDEQPDVRQRDEEFSLSPKSTAAEAKAKFDATLEEVCGIVGSLAPERLMTRIDPLAHGAWRNVTILEAIFQVVGHLQLHAGQILMSTKQLLARDLDLSIPRKR